MKSFAFLLGSSKKKATLPPPLHLSDNNASRPRSDSDPPPREPLAAESAPRNSSNTHSIFSKAAFSRSTPRVDYSPQSENASRRKAPSPPPVPSIPALPAQPTAPRASTEPSCGPAQATKTRETKESELYARRRARSIGHHEAPKPNLAHDAPILPKLPPVAPLTIFKDLPTPITPSHPPVTPVQPVPPVPVPATTPQSPLRNKRSFSPTSRAKLAKRSMPELDGVWAGFLRDAEEDMASLGVDKSATGDAKARNKPPSRPVPPVPILVRKPSKGKVPTPNGPLTPPITPPVFQKVASIIPEHAPAPTITTTIVPPTPIIGAQSYSSHANSRPSTSRSDTSQTSLPYLRPSSSSSSTSSPWKRFQPHSTHGSGSGSLLNVSLNTSEVSLSLFPAPPSPIPQPPPSVRTPIPSPPVSPESLAFSSVRYQPLRLGLKRVPSPITPTHAYNSSMESTDSFSTAGIFSDDGGRSSRATTVEESGRSSMESMGQVTAGKPSLVDLLSFTPTQTPGLPPSPLVDGVEWGYAI